MPECELENMGLVEAVTEAGPSTLEYQTLSAQAPVVNGEDSGPTVTGMSQFLNFINSTHVFMSVHQR